METLSGHLTPEEKSQANKETDAHLEVNKALAKQWTLEFGSVTVWLNQPKINGIREKYIAVSSEEIAFYQWENGNYSKFEVKGSFTSLYKRLLGMKPESTITVKGFTDGGVS